MSISKMKKRFILIDFAIYFITSIRFLLFRGKIFDFYCDVLYFIKWRFYRYSNKGTLDYQIPWLVFSCINYLDKIHKKGLEVFEYGSGGSTIYFAKNGSKITSVEHDANWYFETFNIINKSGFTAIDYKLIEPKKDNCIAEKNVEFIVIIFLVFKSMKDLNLVIMQNQLVYIQMRILI
jgi:hypothetical protein